ncbi:FKBP-type peptidyl-prolyl cis-trans isomerase [Terrimonas sp. NA20]|uniref:Peptidyl-prolyl cis-trans isomerase n=1 Tax=Terrimonas ginsenosidimutans TaxID=2908004 RepID=A0ABS9KSI9_9BACT|nr:FKBP-type peptidyl-prolyl cis-trans isomerase [Terrimonas ginsenosidimutans]MCG2615279.1 FKBP-type peptidyl-prolyl cis-trans isomerase [Terrimonas ginsenosidimutans]
MRKILALVLVFSLLFAGCSKDDNECKYDVCGIVAPESEIAAVQSHITSKGITAERHCSGVFYTVEVAGTGKNPTPCSNILIKYKGYLTNGSVFDQAVNPVAFGLGELISGWRSVLPTIKAGGRIVLYIPPSLGYGNRASGSIPANSIIIFEIDLLDVQ